MSFYKFARGIGRAYLRIFYRLDVRGLENIPLEGPVVLSANHVSNIDPVMIGCSIDRVVHYMAKSELFRCKYNAKILGWLNAFPVKRGSNDRTALKKSIEILSQGGVLGIFPEGARRHDGIIGKGHPGAAFVALKTDAKIVPIGIVSAFKLYKPVYLNIGNPISLEQYKDERTSTEIVNKVTEHLMERIREQVAEIKAELQETDK
jgi:1-acyl-sn-glycerol-3-phosphate acyltransferase